MAFSQSGVQPDLEAVPKPFAEEEGNLVEAETVAEKVLRHSKVLGGISRVTFQLDTASVPHETSMQSIEMIGITFRRWLRTGEI